MEGFNLFSRGNVLQYKVLSNDELYELIKEYKENKTEETLEKLINHNLRMIVKIANGFANYGCIEDIRQEALMGFITGVENIDLDRNIHCITSYLWQTTKNALIGEFVRNQNRDKRKIQFYTSSYDRQLPEDADGTFFHNFAVDNTNIEEEIINKITVQEFKKILTKKEYYYLERFYGLNGFRKHSAEELSKMANVKATTVNYTLYQARLKIKEVMKNEQDS